MLKLAIVVCQVAKGKGLEMKNKSTFEKIRLFFKTLIDNFNKIKQTISATYQTISNSMPVKIIYYFFRYFGWFPIKYSVILCYYVIVWPLIKVFGGSGSSSTGGSGSSSTGTSFLDGERRWWSVQVFRNGMWVNIATSQNQNPNYISKEVSRIKEQNVGIKTRAIYKDTGQVIESA